MPVLLLVAVSVALSNFAAAISLGVAGVTARVRLRVGLVFGAFEAGMPVVGVLLGDHLAAQLGQAGRWVGGALLIGVGLFTIISSRRAGRRPAAASAPSVPSASPDSGAPDSPGAGQDHAGAGQAGGASGPPRSAGGIRLVVTGLALSLDNLVAGFALGTYGVGILAGAVVFGAVSVGLSLLGLELGARLGGWASRRARAGHPVTAGEGAAARRSDQLGGVILVSVGIAIAAGALS